MREGEVRLRRRWAGWAAVLAVLAVLPYLPVFIQPFVSDDYVQIDLGRKYGPVAAWADLLADPLYRCRATSILLTHWTEQWFGLSPLPYYTSSVLFHIFNTWLVALAGWRLGLGRTRSLLAALFFAVYLGHQEAVMWYASLPELLLFFFCGCFLLSWNRFLQTKSIWDYGATLLWFVLALASKEGGVVLVPIAAAMAYQRRRNLLPLLPFAAGAAVYAAAIFAAKADHLHLNDGTFSLHAPFVATWARSIVRMFWIWGFLALSAIVLWRRPLWRSLRFPALWIAVALLPYSFLLYMPVVPSRHTYLASAGVGFVVATGLLAARARYHAHRWVLPLLAGILIAHHTGYIWIKKRVQFLERAEATEELVRLASQTSGLIYVNCFPYGPEVAELALKIRLNQSPARLVFSKSPPPGATTFCAKDP